jgi:ATP-dependent DNA ligase
MPEKKASRLGESLTADKMDQCRWVKSKLVCQVAFVEWTDARHLRHCTFVAMRHDKKPAAKLEVSSWRLKGDSLSISIQTQKRHAKRTTTTFPLNMTTASNLLQRHFQTLVEDNA